jgi:hypothetical protein
VLCLGLNLLLRAQGALRVLVKGEVDMEMDLNQLTDAADVKVMPPPKSLELMVRRPMFGTWRIWGVRVCALALT